MRKDKIVYNFEKRVAQTIAEHSMLQKGDRVLVGLSGGADSVSLLFSLLSLSKALEFSVYACHVNHGIRKTTAKRDEDFCKELCKRLGVPFYRFFVDVPTLCKAQKGSTEQIAREARYSCFERLCHEYDFNKIATAHTLSDNAETVFFNICKGCSPDALGGIPYFRDSVIRPLRDLTRNDVESYLSELGESFVTDETNYSQDYDRNYIRHTLIPAAKRLNPSLEYAIGRLSKLALIDKGFFKKELAGLLTAVDSDTQDIDTYRVDCSEDGQNGISVDMLNELPPPLSRRLLTDICKKHTDGRVTQKHIDSLFSLVQKGTDGKSDLPRCKAVIRERKIYFLSADFCEKNEPCCISSTVDSLKNDRYFIDSGDFRVPLKIGTNNVNSLFLIKILPRKSNNSSDFPNILKFENNVYKLYEKIDCGCDIIVGSLVARPRMSEDKFLIGGIHRLLKKVYSERQVSSDMRKYVPLVCDGNGILCLPFFKAPRDGATATGESDSLSIAFYVAADAKLCKE